jgi:hypothetical protein
MSRKEIVSMVSRAFALLLIMWAFTELTYLPDRLLGLIHHVNERSTLTQHDYWTSYYLILTVFTVLRILVFLLSRFRFGDADHGWRQFFHCSKIEAIQGKPNSRKRFNQA